MSQTPTTVLDLFTIRQTTSDPPIQNPSWRPVDSFRQLTKTDAFLTSNINLTDPSRWVVSAPDNQGFSIPSSDLIYTPPGGSITSYDISNISTINLNNVIFTNPLNTPAFTFVLELTQFGGGTGILALNFNAPPSPLTVTFDLSDPAFAGIDLTNISKILFRVEFAYQSLAVGVSIDSITSTLICVARDTMIMLPNGTQKPIQDIKRGDLIAGNSHTKPAYRVARIIHTKLSAMSPVSLVKISKNALGINQPNADTIITGNHPVLYNNSRYQAKTLRNIAGVKYYGKNNVIAKDVLPKNDDGTYSLYNIQFEHDGFYVANGLVVDSVPSHSQVAPLTKESFFNQRLHQRSIKIIKPKLMKRYTKKDKINI